VAKNAAKSNALGLDFDPKSFTKTTEVTPPPSSSPATSGVVIEGLEVKKPLTKGVSLTLREDTIEKLKKAAKANKVSVSKLADYLISKGLEQ